MKHRKKILSVIICSILFSFYVYAQVPQLSIKEIMADPPIEGKRPYSAEFSQNGELISYLWQSEDDSVTNLWIVNSEGENNEKLLNDFRGFYRWIPKTGLIIYSKDSDFYTIDVKSKDIIRLTEHKEGARGCLVSSNGKFIVYSNKKGIWKLDIAEKESTQLTTVEGNRLQFSPDESVVSYTKDNNIYNVEIKTRQTEKLTEFKKIEDKHKDQQLRYYKWSPDGRYIVLTTRIDNTPARKIVVPNYLEKYVKCRPARNSFPEDKFDDTYIYLIDVKNNEIKEIDTGDFKRFVIFGIKWAKNCKYFVMNKIMENFQERYLLKVNPKTLAVSILDYEKDDAWISFLETEIQILKGDKHIIFTSERSGYNHLYKISANGGNAEQLTSGDWEIGNYELHPDNDKVIYTSTEVSTSERHIYVLDIKNGKKRKLKTVEGMNTRFLISEDGDKILYRHMNIDYPYDYYLINIQDNSKPIRITKSVPEKFDKVNWIRPKFIEYKNIEDRIPVKARLYLPNDFDKDKKYPLVIFIHGAGYLQNVVKGWSPYTPNIKWHTRLIEKGYIVLDPDFRGSAGYGRDFRTGIYLHMGGKDLSDIVSGVEYLKEQGIIDENRVGVYGGSYGGFLTLMCLCLEPEHFTCGAALRSVTDWKNYNSWYTQQRLGNMNNNPDAYEVSSPITYAEKLSKPLLLIHGLVDSNVFAQDSFQFAEKLIQAGIPFDFMIYPSQNHSFDDPECWTDEYRRIEEFFDIHLSK